MALAVTRSVRPSVAGARAARPTVAASRVVRRTTLVRAEPEKSAVETAIKEAEVACDTGSTGECAAAWDNVEEISAAVAHKKVADSENSDPLDKFCEDNPEADECRIYDD